LVRVRAQTTRLRVRAQTTAECARRHRLRHGFRSKRVIRIFITADIAATFRMIKILHLQALLFAVFSHLHLFLRVQLSLLHSLFLRTEIFVLLRNQLDAGVRLLQRVLVQRLLTRFLTISRSFPPGPPSGSSSAPPAGSRPSSRTTSPDSAELLKCRWSRAAAIT